MRQQNWIARGLLALFLLASFFISLSSQASDHGAITKGYVDTSIGQIHYRMTAPAEDARTHTPVVFFHQNPKSSDEYTPILPLVGRDRVALALDTPGYGESAPTNAPVTMDVIADILVEAINALGFGAEDSGPIDVFGFHTGTVIATEVAIRHPELVRKVVLSGVPLYPPEIRASRFDNVPADGISPYDADSILRRWAIYVQDRPDAVPFARGMKHFVESLHSIDRGPYIYFALWQYPMEERFAAISQPSLILQPHEMLTDMTLAAHKTALSHADLIELPDIKENVFDTGAEEISRAITGWLDQ